MYIRCMYIYSIYTLYYNIRTVYIQNMYSICTIYLEYIYNICTVYVHYIYCICTVYVQDMYSIAIPDVCLTNIMWMYNCPEHKYQTYTHWRISRSSFLFELYRCWFSVSRPGRLFPCIHQILCSVGPISYLHGLENSKTSCPRRNITNAPLVTTLSPVTSLITLTQLPLLALTWFEQRKSCCMNLQSVQHNAYCDSSLWLIVVCASER
jgi:hypothetical protein